MNIPGWVSEYSGMTGLTALGALARGNRWVDPITGKFSTDRFLTEAATAAGLAVVAIGLGSNTVEPAALAAICVGAGWLGPDTVWAVIKPRIGVKDDPRTG